MKKLYHTLAYNFENIVFLFIGIGFFGFELAYKFFFFYFFLSQSANPLRDMGAMLFICSFLAINLARYFMVFLISEILNFYRTVNKITPTFKFVMWFSGFRGAMGFPFSFFEDIL